MNGHFDVIVIGAGLVGATLAAKVANGEAGSQLRIAVVEAGAKPARFDGENFDPRVVALTPASQQLLESIDCWTGLFTERACPYRDMEVWDGEGTGRIEFSAEDLHSDTLGHIVENSVALRAVRQRLSELNVSVIQPAKVIGLLKPESAGQPVQLTLEDGRRLNAPLIVAADGAHSQVRELAGFATREWTYDQRAIITTIRTEKPHNYTARQRFMRTGPLALLPLRWHNGSEWDAHYCSIVWSADNALSEELMALDDAEFCARLGRDFEHRLGEVTGTAERFAIPLYQRHARQYIQPGIALVGDAAHSIHPLAGQGVNLGLRDVQVFAAELERAVRRGLQAGDYSVLRRYQRQRLGDNLAMMGVMEGFKRLFGNSNPELTWLRNAGMGTLNQAPLAKNAIVRRAMGF
ncbi:UbiH/UbiF/VisC/COQ6 family ubiquinone biosynthesis hydroxylase [Marinimicrobium sp. ABcell2]|uniref:UbiH/UbiF/VisC/COQ6 family ubiquinone biosynthesis hydroxylase n=1 Tax=Marinimicrobium sp. ABcell2 TaxID=3069751 RepID=UPI0027B5E686|nr:UbiH/UbiF/VisC/COQ6 family ubiquinone biosynthesis hydroxylase [Marinimicrobium sp. ABcell2]MDQ2076137.1 UbiH/UbiF/VisC/COQ6 family ubiquinone biosynthesis hydroxylase [Marinimicrobium sp. ABcell2]